MKKHRIWYGILCLFALIIYIIANDQTALIFLIALWIMPVFTFLLQKFSIAGCKLEIDLKTSCYVNQKIRIKIKLHRKHRILSGPLYLNFHFHNTL